MGQGRREIIIFLAGFTFSTCFFSFFSTTNYPEVLSRIVPIFDECQCVSKQTGEAHSFCYVDPQNNTSVGKKFNCSYLEHLEDWGILNYFQEFVNTSKPLRAEEDVVFLSAISDDHFKQAEASLTSIRKFYPNQTYIVYSLMLNATNRELFQKHDNVEVRDFNFSKYPSYVTMWLQYRWKPLIIAEVLKEYPNIWWMDAHVEVKGDNFTDIIYGERANNRVESDIVIPTYTSHSNFAVLDPGFLDYIPSNSIPLLQKEVQMGANLFYVARTRQSLEFFKWWTLCALEETCMSPPNAKLKCNFTNDRYMDYAGCFRYDQSVINMLLLNKFQNHARYVGSVGGKIGRQ